MIDFYTAKTPNGYRVELMLEELGLAYTKHALSLFKGDQHAKLFKKLNPSARIPVIVDHHALDKGGSITLSQSVAILLYLAEKTGQYLSRDAVHRAKVLECLFFDASDIASTRFDAFYLDQAKQSKAAELLKARVMTYYAVYEQQLATTSFLAGDEYSVADIAAYPWAITMAHPQMENLPHLQRWMQEIGKRASVKRVFTQHLDV